MAANLGRVVLAQRVGRGLESGRVPGLDRLLRALEHARLRVVGRMVPCPPVGVIEAIVQGLVERLPPGPGAHDALLGRAACGLPPDGDLIESPLGRRHGRP